MKYVTTLLLLTFLGGIAGTYYYWPGNRDQQSTAFFSLLQFIAAFGLIFLTFLYVKAAQEQLTDQNRAPRITITGYHYPQIDPFVLNFEIEVANPSVRATSLAIKEYSNRSNFCTSIYFEVSQARKTRITIPARDLVNVTVKATNFNPPGVPITLGSKTRTLLTFDEIFHGTLPAVVMEV